MTEITNNPLDDKIDRYLNGHMEDAERTAFEVAMVSDQALLERVQLLDAFKSGLQDEEAALTAQAQHNVLSFGSWLRQPLSMAASLLVLVMGAQVAYRLVDNTTPANQTSDAAIAVNTFVLLEGGRNDAATVARGSPPYLFQLDAGLTPPAAMFDVDVAQAASQVNLLSERGLSADLDGWVRFLVNKPLDGELQVTMRWVDANGTAQQRQYDLLITR